MPPDNDLPAPVHILIVDDQPENLLSMEAVLTSPEISLVLAKSGKEALRAVLDKDFALILLDVQMPIMDGFETAAIIRQRERSRLTPIIFVTAINKSERNIFQGYSFGAVDYVFKPFMPEILKSKVDVFIDLFKKSKEMKERLESLEQMNRDLEASCQTLASDFQATLERGAPLLRRLIGYLEGASKNGADDLLQTLREETVKVNGLTSRLGDFTRTTTHLFSMDRVPLNRVCQNSIKGLMIEGAPPVQWLVSALPEVLGDEAMLNLLFEHLLANAMRYLGTAPTVEIASYRAEDEQVITIHDNGPGYEISSHDILEAFERQVSGNQAGAGISMVVARRILRRHGGRIWARSEPGQGATVSFTLSAVAPHAGEGERPR